MIVSNDIFVRKLLLSFRGYILAVPSRVIAIIFFILLAIIPILWNHPYILKVLAFSCLFAVFAASWDLLSGVAGQVNLGHALFFGLGAYTAALLDVHLDLIPLVTVPAGAIIAVVGGLIASAPALRMRGIYLVLVTLALPIILSGVIFALPHITGGEVGIYGVKNLSSSGTTSYYCILFITLISLFVLWKFTDSKSRIIRTGIIFRAIREDEIACRTSGINTVKYKILAFVVAGFFAGVSGALYAHYVGVAGPSTLAMSLSFNALLWTIFGGVGTIYGSVAGVFILLPISEFLRLNLLAGQIRFIAQAILLIVVLFLMPQGITIWVRSHIEKKCLRCRVINIANRRYCRECGATL